MARKKLFVLRIFSFRLQFNRVLIPLWNSFSISFRRILGEEGFISVVVVIDSQSGKIVAGPDIHARGFAEDLELFDEVKTRIEKALAIAVADGINGTHQLSQVVRKTVGGWVGGEHRRRPMIVPLVIEV